MLTDGDKVPTGLKGILVEPSDVSDDPKETKGKKVSLSSLYKENDLILYFYPKDSTPGCTIEAQNFRDSVKKLQKAGFNVVGCSRDDEKSHAKFITKQNLNFPLLYDDSGDITEKFGIWQEKKMYGKTFMGIVRSTFIIRKGKVLKAYPKVSPKKHVDEILEFIKENK